MEVPENYSRCYGGLNACFIIHNWFVQPLNEQISVLYLFSGNAVSFFLIANTAFLSVVKITVACFEDVISGTTADIRDDKSGKWQPLANLVPV